MNPRRPIPPAWLSVIGIGNLTATLVLLVASWFLIAEQPEAGRTSLVLVPLAVLPLLAMRRHPAAAPVATAVITLLTQIVAGPLITCGVVLPTAMIMAFQLGSGLPSTRQQAVGGLGLLGVGLVEVLLDPVLGSVAAAVFVLSLGTTFFAAGLVVRSRVRMVLALRRRAIELAEQRDRTAALAVAADRERIGADLNLTVRARIAAIAATARAVTAAQSATPTATATAGAADAVAEAEAEAQRSLAEIERLGRETLAQMRAVVGVLHDAPTEPPPGLDDLPELVRRAGPAQVRLRFAGQSRRLPPNVELCAYRIVERLLPAVSGRTVAEVSVGFESDVLRVDVSGDASGPAAGPGVDAQHTAALSAALTAARTRAQAVGGRLVTTAGPRRRRVEVRLPIPVPASAVPS